MLGLAGTFLEVIGTTALRTVTLSSASWGSATKHHLAALPSRSERRLAGTDASKCTGTLPPPRSANQRDLSLLHLTARNICWLDNVPLSPLPLASRSTNYLYLVRPLIQPNRIPIDVHLNIAGTAATVYDQERHNVTVGDRKTLEARWNKDNQTLRLDLRTLADLGSCYWRNRTSDSSVCR